MRREAAFVCLCLLFVGSFWTIIVFFEIRGTIKKQIDFGIYKLILADIDVFLRITNNLALGKNKFKIHNEFISSRIFVYS